MSVILILILASLAVALLFLGGFIWAVRSGQFEDTCTPGMRILGEDERGKPLKTTVRDALTAERPPATGINPSETLSRRQAGAPFSQP